MRNLQLAPGEEVLIRSRRTLFVFVDSLIYNLIAGAFALCFFTFGWFGTQTLGVRLIIALSPLVITILLFINDIINYYYHEVIVTNMRILGKTGILALSLLDIPISRVTNVKVDMSMLGNIFDFGTLTVYTPGGDFVYEKLNNPLKIQSTFNSLR